MTIEPRACDCCHRLNGNLQVYSSALGPMSLAYCYDCSKENAEPEWGFEYFYSWVGTKGEGLAVWVDNIKTYKDDKYWSWQEWLTWRRTPGDAQKALDDKYEADCLAQEAGAPT